ncbi:phosphotransferase [Bacillus sp. FJAT-49711]|uniref:phosphotransferase enzyme family protein n=1 Tax=Bacillus sp. FJAT-49711 TaxID=2833585 RepID=UPI001BC8D7C7|nr:phosphotransferase [Bacillus sp. FJAT-49711]MBS4220521.1 phosphotransferase [Bacillus sp. FJAT-49711]
MKKLKGEEVVEQDIIDHFNKEILSTGANRFGIPFTELSHLGNWQNFIYEYKKANQKYILRFTPSSHRSVNAVIGEMDWLLYLAQNDVSVSRPIQSKSGNYVEVINTANVVFIVSSFIKAEGSKIGYPECLNDTNLYYKLGQIMGKVHSLSKVYKPKDELTRRHDWHQNYYLKNVDNFIPSDQILVLEASRNVINKIQNNIPKDENSYGLIHGDIGVGNFLVNDEGKITLFDFDEAQYSWFIEDIAIPLYYFVYVYGGEDGKARRESQARLFMEHFLKGYKEQSYFDEKWLKQIPIFLLLREIIVYAGCYRSWDFSTLHQWNIDWLKESRIRIENSESVVNIW